MTGGGGESDVVLVLLVFRFHEKLGQLASIGSAAQQVQGCACRGVRTPHPQDALPALQQDQDSQLQHWETRGKLKRCFTSGGAGGRGGGILISSVWGGVKLICAVPTGSPKFVHFL